MRCPSCGSGNREGAKFCNECAAPLPLRCLPSLHGTAVVIERAQDHPHREALRGLSEGVCDLGPVMAGAIYDRTGSYQWAFLLCVGMLLVGAGVAVAATAPHAARLVLTPGYVIGHERKNRPL